MFLLVASLVELSLVGKLWQIVVINQLSMLKSSGSPFKDALLNDISTEAWAQVAVGIRHLC
jgi:hypothetical protein